MKRVVLLFLSCLASSLLLLNSCGASGETTTGPAATMPSSSALPTTTTTPTLARTPSGESPKYGGTVIFRMASDPTAWDPWFGSTSSIANLWAETLGRQNWTGIKPEVWDFKARFTPVQYATGLLAESWDVSDWATFTFRLRKGIKYQNKTPVNGRELTAYDVEYSYQRLVGLGSFSKGSPYVSLVNLNKIASVTATDKYTVVFKMKEPTMFQFQEIVDDHEMRSIVPREAVDQAGGFNDWTRVVGSGPFIVKDSVRGSSMTFARNPDYWRQDDQYPNNKLPYVDAVKFLIIPDASTSLAALRTGKLDRLSAVDWEQLASLQKTDSELQVASVPGSAVAICMQVDKKPFDDIRVRKALQMAVDLETIARTHYGGTVPGKPVGLVGFKGYNTPFEQWPEEVKKGYLYNPEGAKDLLKQAGYPNGFKTTLTIPTTGDQDLYLIIKEYLGKIGADVAISLLEPASFNGYVNAGKAEMSSGPSFAFAYDTRPPIAALSYRVSTHPVASPITHINDPIMDELHRKADTSLDPEAQRGLIKQADDYVTAQQWTTNLVPTVTYDVYQPWVKRYFQTQNVSVGAKLALLWIDEELKRSAGH